VAISHPEGTGSRVAMENALAATGIAPGEVDYVNAHATSTLIGDLSEARALRSIFGEMGVRPAISSTKALTGHGLSLAGAMETGFCALSYRHGFIPGSAHITKIDPGCEGLNIIRSTVAQAPRVVLKISSGFGGANVALLMRRS
jgi:3-oxoacyl-(acyl-carrier-protein) synthase